MDKSQSFIIGEEGINFSYVKDVTRMNVLIIISKNSHPEDHSMMSRINFLLIHLVSKNKLSNKLRILRKHQKERDKLCRIFKKCLISLKDKHFRQIKEVIQMENPVEAILIFHGVTNQKVYKTLGKKESVKIGS